MSYADLVKEKEQLEAQHNRLKAAAKLVRDSGAAYKAALDAVMNEFKLMRAHFEAIDTLREVLEEIK